MSVRRSTRNKEPAQPLLSAEPAASQNKDIENTDPNSPALDPSVSKKKTPAKRKAPKAQPKAKAAPKKRKTQKEKDAENAQKNK